MCIFSKKASSEWMRTLRQLFLFGCSIRIDVCEQFFIAETERRENRTHLCELVHSDEKNYFCEVNDVRGFISGLRFFICCLRPVE